MTNTTNFHPKVQLLLKDLVTEDGTLVVARAKLAQFCTVLDKAQDRLNICADLLILAQRFYKHGPSLFKLASQLAVLIAYVKGSEAVREELMAGGVDASGAQAMLEKIEQRPKAPTQGLQAPSGMKMGLRPGKRK